MYRNGVRSFVFLGVIILGICSLGITAQAAEEGAELDSFAFQLYKTLNTEKDKNIVISPFSVAEALMMLAEGAVDETKNEILSTLAVPSDTVSMFPVWRNELLNNGSVQLNIADSVWVNEGMQINPEYTADLKKYFNAEVIDTNFELKPELSRKVINNWVAAKTDKMIPELLPEGEIDVLTRMLLVNALYFNGKWAYPFDTNDTKVEDFTDINGKNKSVHMMSLEKKTFRIQNSSNFSALEIPYKNKRFNMIIMLPKEGSDLKACEAEAINHNDWFKGWAQQIKLKLPRFEIDYSVSLRSALRSLGMEDAFDEQKADFSRISESENLFVSKVIHASKIQVEESGTKAAAATAQDLIEESVDWDSPEKFEFVVDRPFMYLIRDNQTGLVLFVGKVVTLPDVEGKVEKVEIIERDGYDLWKFGMTNKQVMAVKEAAPYEMNNYGDLRTKNAPWEGVYNKKADFEFDINDGLAGISLTLGEELDKDSALKLVTQAENYIKKVCGDKISVKKELLSKIAAKNKDFPALVFEEPVVEGTLPRLRVELMRHPQMGWFVFLKVRSFGR